MKMHRLIPAALAIIVILPAATKAKAQEVRGGAVVRITPSRGFIGVLTDEVPSANANTPSRARVVREVVAGSPAEKAGIMKGDTIVRINGAAATSVVMATPYEPGDTVTLRLRRNGRERAVRVVIAERPQTQVWRDVTMLPADINERINIIQSRIHAGMDSARIPLFIKRVPGDSTIVFGGDTIRIVGARAPLFVDSIRASVMRLPHDSSFTMLRLRDGTIFRTDSARTFFRPAEIATGTFTIGRFAVAGAELHDLNPELGASFGTERGVLVLNARDGTPAARAGLRGGDVILRANGTDVSTITELRRAIEAARGGDIQLRVLRRGQTVDIKLPRE